MVDSVVDPVRVPTITLSQTEVDDIKALIEAGQLPPDFLKRHEEAKRQNVFGFDHTTDADGNPQEQGIGSAKNQTRNQINAYKKYAKYEADYSKELYDATVARMEAELAACEKARAAKAKAPARR
jgi:hypothetical protein